MQKQHSAPKSTWTIKCFITSIYDSTVTLFPHTVAVCEVEINVPIRTIWFDSEVTFYDHPLTVNSTDLQGSQNSRICLHFTAKHHQKRVFSVVFVISTSFSHRLKLISKHHKTHEFPLIVTNKTDHS